MKYRHVHRKLDFRSLIWGFLDIEVQQGNQLEVETIQQREDWFCYSPQKYDLWELKASKDSKFENFLSNPEVRHTAPSLREKSSEETLTLSRLNWLGCVAQTQRLPAPFMLFAQEGSGWKMDQGD